MSVIVCTYNQEKTIKRTLDSIIAQKTNYRYEIIIGEDNSSDLTRQICESYVRLYDFIKLMPSAPNKGVFKNYYDCLKVSSGYFIMGCAGDDWWHNPNKLQLQVDMLYSNPNYVLVYGGYRIYNSYKNNYVNCYPKRFKSNDIYSEMLLDNIISAVTVSYRKNIVIKYLNYEELSNLGVTIEDYPILLLLSQHGEFARCDELLSTYTLASGSISNCETIDKKEKFEQEVYKIRRYFIEKYPSATVTIEDLRDKYFLALSTNGLRYNNKRYFIENIKKIKSKRCKDYLKVILCYIPYGFYFLRKRVKSLIMQ